MATNQSEYFYRIVTLLVDGGSMVLRKLLMQNVQTSGHTLRNFLLSHRGTIFQLKKVHVLHQTQVDKLLPQPGDPDPNIATFDITLLCVLLKNVCVVTAPQTNEIDNIRVCRNNIYAHSAQAVLDLNQFQQHWADISQAITNLASSVTDPSFVGNVTSFIVTMKSCPLDVSSSLLILRDWYTNDLPQIKSDIAMCTSDIQTLTTKVTSVKSDICQIQCAVTKSTLDIESSRSDIQTLEIRSSGIEADILSLTSDVVEMKGLSFTMEHHKQDLHELKQTVARVAGNVKDTQTTMKETGDSERETKENKDLYALRSKLIEIYTKMTTRMKVSPVNADLLAPVDELYTRPVIAASHIEAARMGQVCKYETLVRSYDEIFFREHERRDSICLVGSVGSGKTAWCNQVVDVWCRVHQNAGTRNYIAQKGQTLSNDKSVLYPKTNNDRERLIRKKQSDYVVELSVPPRAETYFNPDSNENDKNEQLSHRDRKCMLLFDLLLFIPLGESAFGGKRSMLDAFCSTTLERCPQFHAIVKEVVKNGLGKVLVICDGLEGNCNIPTQEYMDGCTLLTTMRPWEYDRVRSNKYVPDFVLEMKGLDAEGTNKAVLKLSKYVYNDTEDVRAKQCKLAIQKAGLSDIVQIPMMLSCLVHLWYSEEALSSSCTKNTMDLLTFVLETGYQRVETVVNLPALEEKWSNEKLPGSLSDIEELQSYSGLLLSVAKLAFAQFDASLQQKSLLFRGKSLLRYFRHVPVDELQACLDFGLLSSTKVPSLLKNEVAVTFYHDLMQNFFAAVWTAWSNDAFDKLCRLCCKLEDVMAMSSVYTFLSGIDPECGTRFSQHIDRVCSQAPVLLEWRENNFEKDVHVPSTAMRKLSKMHMQCMTEMKLSKANTAMNIHLTDVEIAGIGDFRQMECLLQSANTTLTYLVISEVNIPSCNLATALKELQSLQGLKIHKVVCDAVTGNTADQIDHQINPMYNIVFEDIYEYSEQWNSLCDDYNEDQSNDDDYECDRDSYEHYYADQWNEDWEQYDDDYEIQLDYGRDYYNDVYEVQSDYGRDDYNGECEVQSDYGWDYYDDDYEVKSDYGRDNNDDDYEAQSDYGRDDYDDDYKVQSDYGRDDYDNDYEAQSDYGRDDYDGDCEAQSDYGRDDYDDDFYEVQSDYGRDDYDDDYEIQSDRGIDDYDDNYDDNYEAQSDYGRDEYDDDYEIQSDYGRDDYDDDYEVQSDYGRDDYNDDYEVQSDYGRDDYDDDYEVQSDYGRDYFDGDYEVQSDYGRDDYDEDYEVQSDYGRDDYDDDQSEYGRDFYDDDYEDLSYDTCFGRDVSMIYDEDDDNVTFFGIKQLMTVSTMKHDESTMPVTTYKCQRPINSLRPLPVISTPQYLRTLCIYYSDIGTCSVDLSKSNQLEKLKFYDVEMTSAAWGNVFSCIDSLDCVQKIVCTYNHTNYPRLVHYGKMDKKLTTLTVATT